MKILRIILLALAVTACESRLAFDQKKSLVVEGWIAAGEMPVVMLSTSAALSPSFQKLADMKDHVVATARVSISDGSREAVMMARYDERYPTGLYYTTGWITGEPGKTYTLKVDYKDYHAEAVTTVPENPSGFSLSVNGSGEDCTVLATFDVPEGEHYYRLFSRESPDQSFVPCFLGTFRGDELKNPARVPVHPGKTLSGGANLHSFTAGSVAYVRLCTMDAVSWAYWNAFEEVSSMSASPVFAVRYNLPGNVDGALGYWAGYGFAEEKIVVE